MMTNPKKLTVAEKIAAMKAKSEPEKKAPVSDVKPSPSPSTSNANTSAITSTSTPIKPSVESVEEPKKLTVAEKIAAMKAKSEAEAKAKSSPLNSPGGTSRRASVSERVTIPSNSVVQSTTPEGRPKSSTICSGSALNTEQPSDRPMSTPRKLNSDLISRASAGIPIMGLAGMGGHPGLSKRQSMGSIVTGESSGGERSFQRSSSLGAIRITNEKTDGSFTHSTMTRATNANKRRKSSVTRSSLLQEDVGPLARIDGDRVTTVLEDEEDGDDVEDVEPDNGEKAANTHIEDERDDLIVRETANIEIKEIFKDSFDDKNDKVETFTENVKILKSEDFSGNDEDEYEFV